VCQHLPSPIAAVVRFAHLTGWRVDSEVLTLRWANVDWTGESVRLEAGTTKSGEPRVFPFTNELRQLLREQWVEHEELRRRGTICPSVFHRDGKPIKSFIKVWRTACRAAGCPGRIPHDLRRTAVRNLERAGVPRSTAMAMVGHKTESIYHRYAIVDETSRREAAEKLNLFGGVQFGARARLRLICRNLRALQSDWRPRTASTIRSRNQVGGSVRGWSPATPTLWSRTSTLTGCQELGHS